MIDEIIILKILAVILLVLINGFFVAAEFALVKIRETQLNPLIAQGNRSAKLAKSIVGNLDKYLSAAQLGITLASLALGWVGEPVFKDLLAPLLKFFKVSEDWQHYISFAVGFSTITFLHIVAGEQAPKWLAIQKPLPTTLWVAYPLVWFSKISYPLIWALNNSALWLLKKAGLEAVSESEMGHSEDELRLMLAATQKSHARDLGAPNIVLNAVDLKRRVVRDVMRPRQEMVVFDMESSIADCLELAEKTRYSRFPLCEGGDLDRTVGVVHYKDLFAMRTKARTSRELIAVARRLIYVPETARLEKLLQHLLERKLHFAVVVDEYGGTVGMVTLENILEELVGQIQDEFDQEKPLLVKITKELWDLDGLLPLHQLAQLTGQNIESEGVATVSGWVTQQLGGFPKVGDVVKLGEHTLKVEESDGLKVSKLTLTSPPVLDDMEKAE